MDTQPELDPQTARVLDDLTGPGAVRIPDLSPPEARAAIERFVAKWDLDPQPEVGATEDFDIPGGAPDVALRSRLYRPAGKTGPLPILVFVHAGGFVFGSIETHDSFCRLICAGAECLVLSFEYRLAPEHKFPAAHEDSYAALRWVSENAERIGVDPYRIAVGGDSSGGTMAIAACAMAAERGGPEVVKLMLWYPGTAGGPPTESMKNLSEGYFLDSGLMKWSMGHYLNGPEDMANPWVAPLKIPDFSVLPPTYLLTAGFDPRHDDNELFIDALAQAGVEAEFHSIPNTIHGFMFMLGGIDQAVRAAKDGAASLKRVFYGTI
ncbi:MAG: alpha/beta hydrolase [Rhodospirillaceae bacterium]|nr:alpha/beta hydrolase [Rhodospirillaceae bacterium]